MKLPRGTKLLASRQVAAVSSPLRLEILEHLHLASRSSVAELAALMRRPATALHYHMNVLHRAGIVRVAGRRRSGKRNEAVFQLAAKSFAVASDPRERRSIGDALRTVGATLRLAHREAGRALRGNGGIRSDGKGRNFHSRRMRAPLSETELRRVNALLDQLEALFSRAVARQIGKRGPAAGKMVSLTFVLTPAGASKGGVRR